MEPFQRPAFPTREDRLRLFALGRIPRCSRCPRLDTLAAARPSGGRCRGELPPIPPTCAHQVCEPLAVRYGKPANAPALPSVARVLSAARG
jgi:hypothetical protein